MGRGKDDFIDFTGGFRLGETPEQLKVRMERLQELDQILGDMLAGRRPLSGDADQLEAERRRLRGQPPVEWDYDDPND